MTDITHMPVRVQCPYCKGKRKIPGGAVQYGEVINCPQCTGYGHVQSYVTLAEFKELLK